MNSDIGCALRTEPSTISDSGSVAQHGSGERDFPASPPTVKIIDICAPNSACASTSTMMLRRCVPTIGGGAVGWARAVGWGGGAGLWVMPQP